MISPGWFGQKDILAELKKSLQKAGSDPEGPSSKNELYTDLPARFQQFAVITRGRSADALQNSVSPAKAGILCTKFLQQFGPLLSGH